MNDWKEMIREVMHIRIRHHTENADFMRDYLPHSKDKLEWHESEIASLRNALEQFEKGNSDSYICPDCGDSGGVKTGEDEYSTCPCQNTTSSPMDKLVEWIEGEIKDSKPKAIMYKETAYKWILKKAKELK